ncbi:hypothetical protein NQS96_03410 [Pseudoalteromonas shioyasakiensis]|uniref:hypothetical protein n=1 Tax=Pseudoalteromonas shioyasakiensis TaxID=1190813 RepID=UPI00211939C9|nr:hypothetical protein [Pseudoalteromonas shioyasakiensis]MCQ8880853.1 hypothetical protein [Pseudoalteromonas shioyasakiensis]
MKIFKSILLSSAILSAQAFAQTNSYIKNGVYIFPDAFNTSETEFYSGFPYEVTRTGSLAIWGFGEYSDMRAFLNYYEVYMEELERDVMYQEIQKASRVACPMNEDRTDNKAYMVVEYTDLNFRNPNETGYTRFYSGDVVGGSDWNNNGKIDVLENISELRLSVKFGMKYPSICRITLR